MELFSAYILPVIITFFIGAGFVKGVRPFDLFTDGVAQGLKTLLGIVPSIFALVIAVEMFRVSGALDSLSNLLNPVFSLLGIPKEIFPMAVLRPISGSGSLALLNDTLSRYGAESKIGLISSVICASSETTFYTIAVYYGACGIKNIRYTVIPAIAADISAAIFACIVINFTN
ncbi:MAG: nucleoside recognition domain-containing protein [bacterium]|nr:nucleoside recognition domain-containing protein [bacterium]